MSRVIKLRAEKTALTRPVPAAPSASAAPRIKPGHARSEHLCTRTAARTANGQTAEKGATMGYQQGFATGPGI